MIAAALLLAALAAPTKMADVDQLAIRRVVTERYPSAHVDAVIKHGEYALASARSSPGTLYAGLHLTSTGWRVVCTFRVPPSQSALASACAFPARLAAEIASNASAHSAALRGDFSTALTAERKAFASAGAPERNDERERVQRLKVLSDRMRLGLITREQAIQQWNQFRLSWFLP